MLFNSYLFLFAFLPAVLALFHWPALTRWRVEMLVLASLVFYGYSGSLHAAMLIGEVMLVWLLLRDPAAPLMPARIALAIVAPLLALAFFKYRGFIAGNIPGGNAWVDQNFSIWRNLLLPAGISFFTFEIVCLVLDLKAGRIKKMPRLQDFFLYVAFFPHLVAGPILRWSDVEKPIAALPIFRPSLADVRAAVVYGGWGLAMKVLIADGLHREIQPIVEQIGHLGWGATAYVVGAYSFQIYFDFYGYSLIALGLGRLFGFRFPDNFARPYESLNPKDFWRRWHITLGSWLRDYLYFRLGGNKSYARNILIVFAACGLWHGAGWNFVVWGLYHALLVIGYAALRPIWDPLPVLVQRALTFALVSVGWTLFLFDFGRAWAFFATVRLDGADVVSGPALGLLALAAVVCFGIYVERMAAAEVATRWRRMIHSTTLAVACALAVLFVGVSYDFIYFRF